jgi:hypothetical protein
MTMGPSGDFLLDIRRTDPQGTNHVYIEESHFLYLCPAKDPQQTDAGDLFWKKRLFWKRICLPPDNFGITISKK